MSTLFALVLSLFILPQEKNDFVGPPTKADARAPYQFKKPVGRFIDWDWNLISISPKQGMEADKDPLHYKILERDDGLDGRADYPWRKLDEPQIFSPSPPPLSPQETKQWRIEPCSCLIGLGLGGLIVYLLGHCRLRSNRTA